MAFRKFGQNDIVLNTMRTFPAADFVIYDSKVYYNNVPHQIGAFSNNILGITSSAGGAISLYEYNVDRAGTSTPAEEGAGFATTTGLNPPITPFITKDSARASFSTAGKVSYNNEFQYGDVLTGHYPLTASISRELMSPSPGARHPTVNTITDEQIANSGSAYYPHFYALKNRLNHYQYPSPHYAVAPRSGAWNKATQPLNVLYIPSIFYGTEIKPGSVSLKWYFTGSLIGELKDTKENGELIQTVGLSANNLNKVAGVVMYNEGIILLTGSWRIADGTNDTAIGLTSDGATNYPQWKYFGAGALDGVSTSTAAATFVTASFAIKFQGTTEIQTQTLFAKAGRGQVNHSNNPTFIEFNQDPMERSGSQIYEENALRKIKNTVSSSFATFNAPFKRQVYVSRIGIYDKNQNLIGLATLADPVLKEDGQDYTFKLKLDI